jgi:hypothetical protein
MTVEERGVISIKDSAYHPEKRILQVFFAIDRAGFI